MKECPSCALEVENHIDNCPVCDHEFLSFPLGMQIIALTLVAIMALYLLF